MVYRDADGEREAARTPFAAGSIDKAVVDVSGDKDVVHVAQVRGSFFLD